ARAHAAGEIPVIAANKIAADGHGGRVSDQDSGEVGVFHGESPDHHVTQSGVVLSVNVDAVGQSGSVNDGVFSVLAHQRQRLGNDHIFFISAFGNLNSVARSGRGHRG